MYRYSEEELVKIAAARKRTKDKRAKSGYTLWNCEQRKRAPKKWRQQQDSIKRI